MEQKLAWPTFLQTTKTPAAWKLPPLILHPFTGEKGPDRLLEGSRAQLAMQGLLPDYGGGGDEIQRAILEGKYQELRMLVYIGRDLQRWAEQCNDFVSREPKLRGEGLKEQSFIHLLVETPPAGFAQKLKTWGITDQRAIFSRAIGLNSLFEQPPAMEIVNCKFLEHYQRFSDYLYVCYQSMHTFKKAEAGRFVFEMYASEEYSRILEDGWTSQV